MTDDEILRQLMATFKVELDEHLQAINAAVLGLERVEDTSEKNQLLEEIFREAHSLKGASRAVCVSSVEDISHKLESLFAAAKREEIELTGTVFDLIYESVDKIALAMEAHLKDEDPDFDIARLLSDLDDAKNTKVVTSCGVIDLVDRLMAGESAEPEEPVVENSDVRADTGDYNLDVLTPKKTGNGNGNGHGNGNGNGHGNGNGNGKIDNDSGSKKQPRVGAEETIRVATKKLDSLMSHVEELLVSKIRNEQRRSDIQELQTFVTEWNKLWLKAKGHFDKLNRQDGHSRETAAIIKFLEANDTQLKSLNTGVAGMLQEFSKDNMRLSLITEDLQHDIRKVRMLPVATVFGNYERMVRDLARQQGKEINLELIGVDTELDKTVLEGIKDPIMHLIRNCIDHGLESTAERIAAGKPGSGTIRIRAAQQGASILIEVEDDGSGIDVDYIRDSAVVKGATTTSELKTMSEKDSLFLIFKSGFSTSEKITNVSGRGVGLDVVRRNIEQLNGLIEIESTVGKGTKFSLSLPLTMTTSRVLLAKVCDEIYAIPTSSIERILNIRQDDVITVAGKDAINVNDRPTSLVRLDQILNLSRSEPEKSGDDKLTVVLLGSAEKRIAYVVDDLIGETEIVIKSLGKRLSKVRNVAGATILGTGKVVVILNVADLIKSAHGLDGQERAYRAEEPEKPSQNILVVDDSITTRTLEKNILESVGFQVLMAKDGAEAYGFLQDNTFDLIVSDVDMPIMNGLELTSRVRGDDRLKDIPIILVSSLDSQSDRERGIDVGADAYIVKSDFDQKILVDTINQFI